MIHETIPLPQEVTTLALLVALVAVFYKLMEMVFQTITISVMSGGFYAAFSYLFLGGLPSIMDILLFALLGSVLYIVFTLLESAYTVSKHLVKIPVMILEAVLYPIKKLYKALKAELEKERETKSKTGKTSNDQEGGSSDDDEDDKGTKEVVIDKVQQEDEEE
jgi:hypothetical protein